MQEQFQPVPKAIEVSQRRDKQRFDDPIFDSTIHPANQKSNKYDEVGIDSTRNPRGTILKSEDGTSKKPRGPLYTETKELTHR